MVADGDDDRPFGQRPPAEQQALRLEGAAYERDRHDRRRLRAHRRRLVMALLIGAAGPGLGTWAALLPARVVAIAAVIGLLAALAQLALRWPLPATIAAYTGIAAALADTAAAAGLVSRTMLGATPGGALPLIGVVITALVVGWLVEGIED